jgi:hypothetical protein
MFICTTNFQYLKIKLWFFFQNMKNKQICLKVLHNQNNFLDWERSSDEYFLIISTKEGLQKASFFSMKIFDRETT